MQSSKLIVAVGCVAACIMLQGCGGKKEKELTELQSQMIPNTCETTLTVIFDTFVTLANGKVAEICDKKTIPLLTKDAKGLKETCVKDGEANITAKIVDEKAVQIPACIAALANVTTLDRFNLYVIAKEAQQFSDGLDIPENTKINEWLLSFKAEQSSTASDKDIQLTRLYLKLNIPVNDDNNSSFPWVTLGASMMGVAFAAFGLKRFRQGRAEKALIDEEAAEGLE